MLLLGHPTKYGNTNSGILFKNTMYKFGHIFYVFLVLFFLYSVTLYCFDFVVLLLPVDDY